MALKNSQTVALERRYDLSTLFCMLGRHGPAVAMATVAMLSVLAAFVIYRTVRGQRRKATAAADDEKKKIPGAQKDAAVGPRGPLPNQEESHNPPGSTGESDGKSPATRGETEEDAHLIQGQNLKTNDECCAAAAAGKAVQVEPLCGPPPESCHLQGLMPQTNGPDLHHTPQDDAEEPAAARQCDSNAVKESVKPEINAGSADEFTQCDVDTTQDETHLEETVEGETVEGETVEGETVEGETVEGETVEGETVEGETVEGETVVAETVVAETVVAETVVAETVVAETVVAETVVAETVVAETVVGETVVAETVVAETVVAETVVAETVVAETVVAETVVAETVVAETVVGETVEGETVVGETAQDETAQDETAQDETAQDGGVPDAEGKGCDHESRRREEELHDYKSGQEKDLEMACEVERQEAAVAVAVAAAAVCQDEDEESKPKEEDLQSTMNEALTCTPPVDGDDGLQCENTKEDVPRGALETPVHVPQVKNNANEENEEGDWHQEYLDNGNYHQDAHLSSETEKCVEYQIIPQHAEILTQLPEQLVSVPLTELPSLYEQRLDEEQNECEHVAKNVTLPTCDGAEVDHDSEMVAHVVEEDLHGEMVQVSDPQRPTRGPHLPSVCQQPQNGVTNDEEGAHPSVADQPKETSVTCDDNNHTATHEINEEGDRSSLVLLPSVNQPHATEHCVLAIVIHEDSDIPSVGQLQSEPKEDNGLNADVTDDTEGGKRVENDDGNVPSPTVDEDSGISSLIFSLQSAPQSPDVDDEDVSAPITDEDWDLALDPHPPTAYCCHDTTDMSVTAVNGGHPSMVFGSLSSSCHQPHSYQSGEVTEPLGANNDMFGQAVEDSYYRDIDGFSEHTAPGVTNYTDELNKQTEIKDTAKPLAVKKKEGRGVDEKGRSQAKEGEDAEEEDRDKTEINIMEATMDNNEWMMDGGCQVLPWMDFSLKSYAQNLTTTNQLPKEEPGSCSASTTAATDVNLSNEAKDTTTFSLSDENAGNGKKVAAVQPVLSNVNVTFCVHYLTHSLGQTVAITGNQRELGYWKDFIPLERAKDTGYWASVVSLPAESQVEWKFVLVDEGTIRRWEECENRCLDTGHGDDVHMRMLWGFL